MKKSLLILVVFTLSLNAYSQIPNYVPANGLVGWWPFNGNANDESGNGNNGTVNGAALTTDRLGNANQAYNFDGNDWIELNQLASINNSNELAVSIWVQSTGINLNTNCGSGCAQAYFARGNDGSDGFYVYTSQGISPNFSATVNGPFNGGVDVINPTIHPIPHINWHHLVLNYDGTNLKLFVNGSLVSTINYSINVGVNPSSINAAFGRQFVPNFPYFTVGKLDDAGIWNRALTQCEIQDLYHAQLNSASMNISAGLDQSICAGDNVSLNGAGGSNYQWNNNVVDGQAFAPTQSIAYVVNGTDTLGCQGTDTVVVTVLENSTSTLTETALDSYTLNGQTYTQSGIYTQVIPGANGCDSTITLNLTLNFTGIDELGTAAKKLVNITDLNGKIIPRRKNTVMLFIYEDGTVERVVEME